MPDLDAGSAPVHVAGAQQSDLPEADAGPQGHKHQAIIPSAYHLNIRTRLLDVKSGYSNKTKGPSHKSAVRLLLDLQIH
jgi:hypothetical protein